MIFGPISDAANEKLANDMPEEFVIASKLLTNSTVIPLVSRCHITSVVNISSILG